MTKQPVRPYGQNPDPFSDIMRVLSDIFADSARDQRRIWRVHVPGVAGENQGEMIDAGYFIKPARQANPYANWRSPTLAHRGGSGTHVSKSCSS